MNQLQKHKGRDDDFLKQTIAQPHMIDGPSIMANSGINRIKDNLELLAKLYSFETKVVPKFCPIYEHGRRYESESAIEQIRQDQELEITVFRKGIFGLKHTVATIDIRPEIGPDGESGFKEKGFLVGIKDRRDRHLLQNVESDGQLVFRPVGEEPPVLYARRFKIDLEAQAYVDGLLAGVNFMSGKNKPGVRESDTGLCDRTQLNNLPDYRVGIQVPQIVITDGCESRLFNIGAQEKVLRDKLRSLRSEVRVEESCLPQEQNKNSQVPMIDCDLYKWPRLASPRSSGKENGYFARVRFEFNDPGNIHREPSPFRVSICHTKTNEPVDGSTFSDIAFATAYWTGLAEGAYTVRAGRSLFEK